MELVRARPALAMVREVRRTRSAAGRTIDAVGEERAAVRADLEVVFRRDYTVVVGVAARVLSSLDQAEDVAQEVFLAFSRTPAGNPAGGSARGWLCVAATHTALNHLRSGRRRVAREDAVADHARCLDGAHEPDVADAVVAGEQRAQLRAALGRLPRQQATALVLRHSGFSYAEVATALDLSPTSVGTTLRRAEHALREELSSR